jgi:hypothetical protein
MEDIRNLIDLAAPILSQEELNNFIAYIEKVSSNLHTIVDTDLIQISRDEAEALTKELNFITSEAKRYYQHNTGDKS